MGTAETILNDDLSGLARNMSEQVRIEQYNQIKSDENELRFDFARECSSFRTQSELDQDRSQLRLARLWIAASFYKDGSVPRSMEDDFSEAALQAAVDFDRYKQFDVLDEDQISRRIRRMEGEVYELVKDYTNSQLANLDELNDDPDVQQDVIRQLNQEYDDRLEKVRKGFYTYVEEVRGLGGMVSAVEEAIKDVSNAKATKESVQSELSERLDKLESTVEQGFRQQQTTIEQEIRLVEQELAGTDPEIEEIKSRLDDIDTASEEFQQTTSQLRAAIKDAQQMEDRLDSQIEELKSTKTKSQQAEDSAIADEVTDIVDDELSELKHQRKELQNEIRRLQREREGLESAREQLDERQKHLTDRVDEIEQSVTTEEGGIDGDSVVTPLIARLLELDYIGRFETSMRDTPSIYTGEDTHDIPDGYWSGRSQRSSQRPELEQYLDDKTSVEEFPENVSARYEITSSQFLGLSDTREMIIEASVVSDLEALATNGFDATPSTLKDLLSHVNQTVQEAEQQEVTYLLALASPNGWTDAVEQQITDRGISRTRFSRHVSIILVDLQDGSLIYDRSDPVAERNSSLFELPVDNERIQECIDDIRDRLDRVGLGTDEVILDHVVSDDGYDPHIVKRAFDYYVEEENYQQQYIDNQLVLYEG